MDDTRKSPNLSRRQFIGTVGAVGAAAALGTVPLTKAHASTLAGGAMPAAQFAAKLRRQKVGSDASTVWRQFGPGMAGYDEQVFCHPTQPGLIFTTPDLLNLYRSEDDGQSWQTAKDSDGTGVEATRLNAMAFARNAPNIGYAVNRQGLWSTTDMGKSWQTRPEWVTIVPGDIFATTQPTGPATSVFGGTLSGVAVDPTNPGTIYAGSGDFFNEKLNPHTQANPHGVPPSPDIFWRTNTGKVFKTVDAGASWTLINTGIDPNAEIGPIYVDRRDPQTVYMASSFGFYRSDNGGATWTASNTGLDTGIIRDLTMHFDERTKQTTLYAIDQVVWAPDGAGSITAQGGVFRSADGGRTWTNLSAGLRMNLQTLPRLATVSTIRTIYYRSLSRWFGITAAQAVAQFPVLPADALNMFDRIAVDPTDVNQIYVMGNAQQAVAFKPGDVWSSDDGGQTWFVPARFGTGWGLDAAFWEAHNTPPTVNMTFGHNGSGVSAMPYDQYGFVALGVGPTGDAYFWHYQQIFRSTDRGATWINVDEDPEGAATPGDSGWWTSRGDANPPGRGVVVDPGDGSAYLLVGENGVWRTDPTAAHTVPASSPPPRAQLLRWPGNETAATLATAAPRSPITFAIHPANRDVLYVIADRQDFAGQLRMSTDRGLSWSVVSTPLNVTASALARTLIFDSINTDRMYFCVPNQPLNVDSKTDSGIVRGVYKSSDAGATWQVANNALPEISTGESGSSVYTLAAHPLQENSVFAAVLADGTTPGGLFRSDDAATTWVRVPTPSGVDQVNSVQVHPLGTGMRLHISAGRVDGPVGGGGLWRSDDGGATWTLVFDWPNVFQVRTHPNDPNKLIAILSPVAAFGNINPGIYLSVDAGRHWTKINKGLGEPDRVYDATFDPTRDNVIWCSPWGAAGYVATY